MSLPAKVKRVPVNTISWAHTTTLTDFGSNMLLTISMHGIMMPVKKV